MEGSDLLRQLVAYLGAELTIVEDEGGSFDESFLAIGGLGADIVGSAVRFYGGTTLDLEEIHDQLAQDFLVSVGSDPRINEYYATGELWKESEEIVWGAYLMVWGKRWS